MSAFPDEYPHGSLQRELYNWGKNKGHMNMGTNDESAADFVARLQRQHPEEVSVFIAKLRMGVKHGR